jgi:glucosamine-6-phosphate deaminase
MSCVDPADLGRWCRIPAQELSGHPQLRVPFRIVRDTVEMGNMMAREFVDAIVEASAGGGHCRAIVPCGPKCWYEPFVRLVNTERISLQGLTVFHMDECLDWEGRLLPRNHPFNFRTYMEEHFYSGVDPSLAVPESQRLFLEPSSMERIRHQITEAPVDIALGGWGQDGHLAYNQARRNPWSPVTLAQLRCSSIRIQENNLDTVIALSHRVLGGAWQFVPPMSVTLGMKECLSARKVRVYSDTGSWKQTALRVALFSLPVAEYPMTLLQEHPDAMVTATMETARHPLAENPGWDFGGTGT